MSRKHEVAAVDDCFDLLGIDPGQGDEHQHGPLGLQNVDRRLPHRRRYRCAPVSEKLAMQAICPREHLARLRPHPMCRKIRWHPETFRCRKI